MSDTKPITPAEFADKMRAIYPENIRQDLEGPHCDADRLMMELLTSLGYGDGVNIFAESDKWYA